MRAGRDQVITLRHHGRSTAGFSPMRQAGKPKLTLVTESLLKPPVDAINDQRCVLPHPTNLQGLFESIEQVFTQSKSKGPHAAGL